MFFQEDALNSALRSLTSDVGKKLDKEDVEPLKDYLEARIQATKPKPVEKPSKEEFAAGIRRQFLVNHNCISCDRPVKYASEGMFPPLPTLHSMPGSKSNRPYTTFELEQLRQHMLQGGLAVTKERFEVMDKQRDKLQKEMLRLRLVTATVLKIDLSSRLNSAIVICNCGPNFSLHAKDNEKLNESESSAFDHHGKIRNRSRTQIFSFLISNPFEISYSYI